MLQNLFRKHHVVNKSCKLDATNNICERNIQANWEKFPYPVKILVKMYNHKSSPEFLLSMREYFACETLSSGRSYASFLIFITFSHHWTFVEFG